jgi:uncharacterized protein
VLRGFALLGILLLNIESFAGPESLHDIPVGTGQPAFVGWHARLDLAILALKWVFAEGKMRALFATLFGTGCVLLTVRIERSAGPQRGHRVRARRRKPKLHGNSCGEIRRPTGTDGTKAGNC